MRFFFCSLSNLQKAFHFIYVKTRLAVNKPEEKALLCLEASEFPLRFHTAPEGEIMKILSREPRENR